MGSDPFFFETISSGDEIIRGRSIDTNAPWMAERAAREGVLRTRHTVVGDDPAALARAFLDAGGRADLVVVTGGLGPTEDDYTRRAAADALGVELEFEEAVFAAMEERFRSRGLTMAARNRVQAFFPAGSRVLRNPLGTAAGFRIEIGGAELFFLPGVPREMEVMFSEHVLPALRREGITGAYRAISTFGKPEAFVDEVTADIQHRAGLSVGLTAVYGRIRVTVQTTGPDAVARADEAEAELRAVLQPYVLEADTLEASVAALLARRNFTLATAESCTGGLIGSLLTDVPGISAHYLGGVVAYADSAKRSLLGVPAPLLAEHGAVSEPVARAMAEGVRRLLGADLGVSVTGIAGPGGGTPDKPVGTVYFAVAGPEGERAVRRRFPGDREFVRRFSANIALDLVRTSLRKP
jgi:nicotinamide-nucleotide amidase